MWHSLGGLNVRNAKSLFREDCVENESSGAKLFPEDTHVESSTLNVLQITDSTSALPGEISSFSCLILSIGGYGDDEILGSYYITASVSILAQQDSTNPCSSLDWCSPARVLKFEKLTQWSSVPWKSEKDEHCGIRKDCKKLGSELLLEGHTACKVGQYGKTTCNTKYNPSTSCNENVLRLFLTQNIVIFGGMDENYSMKNDLNLITITCGCNDPVQSSLHFVLKPKISQYGRVPCPRYRHAACATETHMFVFGGECESSDGLSDFYTLHCFDLESFIWSNIELPTFVRQNIFSKDTLELDIQEYVSCSISRLTKSELLILGGVNTSNRNSAAQLINGIPLCFIYDMENMIWSLPQLAESQPISQIIQATHRNGHISVACGQGWVAWMGGKTNHSAVARNTDVCGEDNGEIHFLMKDRKSTSSLPELSYQLIKNSNHASMCSPKRLYLPAADLLVIRRQFFEQFTCQNSLATYQISLLFLLGGNRRHPELCNGSQCWIREWSMLKSSET